MNASLPASALALQSLPIRRIAPSPTSAAQATGSLPDENPKIETNEEPVDAWPLPRCLTAGATETGKNA